MKSIHHYEPRSWRFGESSRGAPRAFALVIGLVVISASTASAEDPLRARDLGIPFDGAPGPFNAITDVAGVEVGHVTLIEGRGDLIVGEGPVRTGVTGVLPTGRDFRPVFAATASLNGNGEMTGVHWIHESGLIEEPIALTNTHAVGPASQGVIRWRRLREFHAPGDGHAWASLPVVAETWDGRLHDIHGEHVQPEHVVQALDNARSGPVAEGNVGGGTGMVCHEFKAGIGTASRRVSDQYTLGVLVQANYGRREDLRLVGRPIGASLTDLMPEIHSFGPRHEGNSIIAIVATDAPLAPHQLKRVARRVPLGIQRTGGYGRNSSGDFFLMFSTAQISAPDQDGLRAFRMIDNAAIDPFFEAAIQAVEEAIWNALVAAETMTGINGNRVHAIPHERIRALLDSDAFSKIPSLSETASP